MTGSRAGIEHTSEVVDDFAADLFTRPLLRRGPDCSLYLFEGRDLLRVRDESRPTAGAGR